jgi:chaperonin GroEL (HSP60 family)
MNKIIINHLDRLFVTSDASVMVTELEVQHPAAKLIVLAAKAQEAEIGDGTNLVRTFRTQPSRCAECSSHKQVFESHARAAVPLPLLPTCTQSAGPHSASTYLSLNSLHMQVISLAGELLTKAVDLLREGLTATEIAEGYGRAADKVRTSAQFLPSRLSELRAASQADACIQTGSCSRDWHEPDG